MKSMNSLEKEWYPLKVGWKSAIIKPISILHFPIGRCSCIYIFVTLRHNCAHFVLQCSSVRCWADPTIIWLGIQNILICDTISSSQQSAGEGWCTGCRYRVSTLHSALGGLVWRTWAGASTQYLHSGAAPCMTHTLGQHLHALMLLHNPRSEMW